MSTSQEYLSRVDAQRQQVRRAREHLDQAEADFHAAAEAWEAADHPEDGELLYAYKRAAVWLSHVAATHQGAVESQDRLLARLFVRDEGVG
ncbi:MAG TPA: hypothetical protein VKB37_11550 [Jatrophihabitantaceae bacterium]|nr:hypothetical protein [Jatrophihabitantaceae bacterium]